MKIDRLIGILTILLKQDKVTAPWLARRFEVSRRTINRDIEDICKAGIPLVTAQGFGGGISIASGYKIDASLLTREELETILAAVKGIDSVSKTSCTAALNEKFSVDEGIAGNDIFLIDLASHYQPWLTQKIDTIKRGVKERQTISFLYYQEKGEGQRTIEPYRLVFQWSSWYVLGYCLDRQDYRLFKLNRLDRLKLTGVTFAAREIPGEALDFGSFLSHGHYRLKALFSPSEKHRLIDEYGVGCFETAEDGHLLFQWDFASYTNMKEWVWSFGDRVEPLEPKRLLRERLLEAENIFRGSKEHDR